MIPAIGAIGYDCDPEYLRIIRELQRYGITPSGNKYVDKGKLERVKKEVAEFSVLKQEYNDKMPENDAEKKALEETRPGAINLAIINRVLLGI